MNIILEKMMGVDTLTDQVIAYDLLNSAKSGVRNYAIAITEAATPEVASTLRKQLEEAIELHEDLSNLLINKGWYHPFNVHEQSNLAMNTADTALHVAD